jgi:hypothetical protein
MQEIYEIHERLRELVTAPPAAAAPVEEPPPPPLAPFPPLRAASGTAQLQEPPVTPPSDRRQ